LRSARIASDQETKKPSEKLGCDGSGVYAIPYLVTPTGVEQREISHGKTSELPSVPMPVPTSETIPGSVSELLEIWSALDDAQRAALMAMARACLSQDASSP